ncbi:hypothetical protein BD324DRAFT_111931 [Kockovaella imperatae]|uniref:Formin GTPase-binding domain-containing protein n=1 Tax=Kockovaella imperatae TaxID=4999 RepID=A0A1Y1UD60_9TREE|nr:hypothetical protein BD324DRAFT_111931 [Kockovaella imperatae]ORX35005.1 hypothetical protein BD324DRAFT_111931 [Kockovaella imperatae]
MCSTVLQECSVTILHPFHSHEPPIQLYLPTEATSEDGLNRLRAVQGDGWTVDSFDSEDNSAWTGRRSASDWRLLRLPDDTSYGKEGSHRSGTLRYLDAADLLSPGGRYLVVPPDWPVVNLAIGAKGIIPIPVSSRQTLKSLAAHLAIQLCLPSESVLSLESRATDLDRERAAYREGLHATRTLDQDLPLSDLPIHHDSDLVLELRLEEVGGGRIDLAAAASDHSNPELSTDLDAVSHEPLGDSSPHSDTSRPALPKGKSKQRSRLPNQPPILQPSHSPSSSISLANVNASASMSLNPSTCLMGVNPINGLLEESPERSAVLPDDGSRTTVGTSKPLLPSSSSSSSSSFFSLSSGTSLGLANYLPQLASGTPATAGPSTSGSGWMERLGLGTITAWQSAEDAPGEDKQAADISFPSTLRGTNKASVRGSTSGSLWAWWNGDAQLDDQSVASHIERLQKHHGASLAQDLTSLRITLSTTRIHFLLDFVDSSGVDRLSSILESSLKLKDNDSQAQRLIIKDVLKCLKVIMNTEVSPLLLIGGP